MPAQFYQVLGPSVAPLLGRTKELREILTRIEGNHLMVVAPKLFGKTVLLHGLIGHAEIRSHFHERILWDLTSHTPTNDEEFWATFTKRIIEQLSPDRSACVSLLKEQPTPTFEGLAAIFDALHADKIRVLLALDGMDEILPTDFVSRNVLDNLRDLGQIGSLKFITASRKPLREISPSTLRPSPFLNIFHTQPARLGAFTEADWSDVLRPLTERGVSLDQSALAELNNWTGGVPILVASICHEILHSRGETTAPVTLAKSDIDYLASLTRQARAELLVTLWGDCDAPLQAHLSDLIQGRPLAATDVPQPRLQELIRRGYVHSPRAGLKSACRLLHNHVVETGGAVPDIKRLFGTKTDFERNIQPLLELRLDEVDGIDPDLRDHLERAIRDLQKPHICITQLRSVADHALDLIWRVETDSGNIRSEWIRSWTGDPKWNPFLTASGRVPSERGDQLFILGKATDDRNAVALRKVTRAIYFLISHIHNIGNLGQHQRAATKGQIDLGFMAANCFAAIQLAEQLTFALKVAATNK
jgi:hypothetical protein